jgi:hypothetical protein
MNTRWLEKASATLGIAGFGFFVFSVAAIALGPVVMLRKVPMQRVEEISQQVIPDFYDLLVRYPDEFKKCFGDPGDPPDEAKMRQYFAEALRLGRKVYIAEGCWHCHSQFVRPLADEQLRFGPTSWAAEHQNELQLPPLFGTRRVGPDLIREAGVRSNDWHAAHFYDPQSVVPDSVMPRFTWFFEERKTPYENGVKIVPNRRGLAIITYVQWLGSWVRPPTEGAPLTASEPAETPGERNLSMNR